MSKKVKKGDIIRCSKYIGFPLFDYNKINYPDDYTFRGEIDAIYAVIEDIVCLETNKVYYKYDLITGHGDRNSKVKVGVKLIKTDFTLFNDTTYFDPHNIYDNWINSNIEKFQEQLEILEKIKKFENNREVKLKRILK